ncbi:hypothetical protein ACVGWL_24550, partial [Enterobacter asburiae]
AGGVCERTGALKLERPDALTPTHYHTEMDQKQKTAPLPALLVLTKPNLQKVCFKHLTLAHIVSGVSSGGSPYD